MSALLQDPSLKFEETAAPGKAGGRAVGNGEGRELVARREPEAAAGSERVPALRRALLLANFSARAVADQLYDAVEQLESAGIDVVIERLGKNRSIEDLIAAHRNEVTLVIVGGGDGTLNRAVDAVARAGLPLGILPLGTANDLARTLNLPTDPTEAARVIAEGYTTTIDLGSVNGKLYFNVASLGLSVRITHELTHEAKKRWGTLAYLMTAGRVLLRSRPFRAQVRCDDSPWFSVRTLQIAVGNGRFYGGGMAIAEDASINDSRLDFYSLEIERWWQVLPLLRALRRGSLREHACVRTLRGRRIEVRTRAKRSINTDGEITSQTPAVFEVVPRALRVCVPDPAAASDATDKE